MIALHPLTHKQWGHDTCPRELLVGCLMVKSRKGELDWGVLNAIAGKNVQGMIEGYELGEPFDCWRKELTA